MKQIKMSNLVPGDIIGIVAPSLHIQKDKKQIAQGIALLKKQGFKIKLGKNFNKKFYSAAGDRYQRAEDINKMFADKKIKAILCAVGGDTANQIIELLDYEMIKKNPKPIIGYSDNTHLLIAIQTKTGMVTFHGPNLNKLSTLTKDSVSQLLNILTKSEKQQNLFSVCSVVKPGYAKNTLVGGNLFVLNALNNSPFEPDYKDKILFWEDINEGLSEIEYQLYQIHNSGILGQIKGMVIGHIAQPKKDGTRPWKDVILELTKKYNYPILKTDCFGHGVKRFYTFPINTKAEINTKEQKFLINL